jgi:hypothetical protein
MEAGWRAGDRGNQRYDPGNGAGLGDAFFSIVQTTTVPLGKFG